ncbi:MAG TPA: amino acid adenylation domain-containing protein [Longimicrobiaceae bacterium]|nr:amino acid adenylation domain-containing protein [Longimicrobiaceae bacterium]
MENVESVYALSPMQQSMLVRTLQFPGLEEYAEQVCWTVEGDFDAPAFGQAWQRVVDRHPVLRTVFFWEGLDQPLQVVRGGARAPLEVLDWRGVPAAEREERFRGFLRDDRRRGFDLASAPLARMFCIRVGEREHRCVWSYHHLLLDGWSSALGLREMFTVYGALRHGDEPRLERPRPFQDFISWLAARDPAAAEAFWRRALAGFTAPNRLTLERPHDPSSPEAPGIVTASLPAGLTDRLRRIAGRHGLTPNTLLQGAWALLLARYSGEEDVVFGGLTSGRPPALEGAEGMLGMFINAVPVRARMQPGARLVPWLRELQAVQSEARHHDYLALPQIQGWSEVPAGERLYDTVYVFQNVPEIETRGTRVAGVEVRDFFRHAAPVQTGQAMMLEVVPRDGLLLNLMYDERRLDRATAERVPEHLAVLLEGFLEGPERRLAELSPLGAAERRTLLVEWNVTEREYPSGRCVHELIAERAARTPHAVAVASGEGTLTYAELDARAGRLAAHLRGRGIGPESRVAVCMERAPEMLVAVFGVLGAGAAYVPLDPASPRDRLAYLLEDSGAPVLLTQERLLGALPEFAGEVVCLDADGTPHPGAARHPSPACGGPDSAAYVIYTSGSTGKPKGVVVTHRSLVNYAEALRAECGIGAGDRVLQFASLSFDASAEEIFPALLGGAVLVLRAPEMSGSVAGFLRACGSLGITVADLPTAFWHEVVAELGREGVDLPPSLRLVIIGGEPALPERVAGWRACVGGEVRLLNTYGPTEATVAATAADLTHPVGYDGGARVLPPVSIGRPVANVRAYVLDRELGPVPVGVVGEMFVGGVGVARGYLGRPDLTAERFVPDPFAGEPGARLCRTGDRVRWRRDGELEFAGRADDQVKIRGFRVEPGEIEAALLRRPEVRDAVVVAREDGAGPARLVAYVVPEEGVDAPEPHGLRAGLAGELPEYMVPSALVLLDRLPLNASGKVDRGALPAPDSARESDDAGAAPRTPVEAALAEIWGEVLRMERVGIRDDFFRHGGHSLLAVRVISRIHRAFGVEVPIRALFDAPTVEAMAARVEAALCAGEADGAPPIVPVPRDRPLPLSFAQQRLWFVEQLDPGDPVYNLPVALRLRGRLDAQVLERALTEIVRRHEVLRTVFRSTGSGEVEQVVLDPYSFVLRRTHLGGSVETERDAGVRELAREEAGAPFDLARGPLLRGTLVRMGDEDSVLLFTMHHIVSDEWSVPVLVREVSALYGAFSRGEPSPLPELPVQYADYAAWQREWLQGERLERQLSYWRGRLAGLPPLLELPTDRPRPVVAGARGGTRRLSLPAEVVDALRSLGRREGTTLFMTLLAGFQALLARYSGQGDVSVGIPVAGRTRVEVEGLIGFFVNTLVIRADLSDDPTVRELLSRGRERMLEAQTHQELPFERLVDELKVERSFSHTPLFQVMFTLADRGGATLRLGEVEVEEMRTGTGSSAFDLSLLLAEEDGGVSGIVEYRTELWEASTVDRMMEHFGVLLAGMAAWPDGRVSTIPLLAPAERRRVVEEWNDTRCEFPRDRCLHELFAEQARRTPDAPAAVSAHEVLTYAELDARATRLARSLRHLGVCPEVRVGICVERGTHFAVAVLAVLRAGGAYVPLDPAYPADRLAYLLQDSGARLLLSQEALAGRLPATPARTLLLDAEPEAISAESAEPLESGAGPENLAYVIYTSGSTGKPKGVAVAHRPVVNYAVDIAARFGLTPRDRSLQFASPGFDVVVEELFPAWLSGGAVVFSGGDLFSPPELLRVLERHGVTWFELPTAYWHEWVHELAHTGLRLPECVRFVIVGGERVSPERLADWARLGLPLVHVFGLTETACTSATLRLEPGDDGSRWPNLPVGTPTGNVRLYVLDARLQPVPVGVPGELYIGGEGLARGYLGRPDLTAEKFVPDLFSAEPGARVYRTGDRVRWLADGTLEFLGRLDHQVKLRGFRIETGEIEAALTASPEVREALVMVREDTPGERRLVAYVVPAAGYTAEAHGLRRASREERVGAGELRERLGRELPEYMVPSAFIFLDELPLTSNGKIDRRALPAPDGSLAAAGREYVAPRSATEEVLAGIWADTLRVERVGVRDDFFALGGHSLLATRVLSRARQTLRVEIPVRVLFETPTVAELAAAAERYEARPGQTEKLARMLRMVATMSPDEVRQRLQERQSTVERS